MDLNEMPNPDVELDHLPFEDGEAFNLLQTTVDREPSLPMAFLDFWTSSPRQCHNDGELQARPHELRAMRAAAIRPTAREIDELLPNLADLFDIWEDAAQTQDETAGPQAAVMVWYLSHLRWRVCQWPKITWLGSDFVNCS